MIVSNWNYRDCSGDRNRRLSPCGTASQPIRQKTNSVFGSICLEPSGFECAFIVEVREEVARQIFLVRCVTAGETVAMIVQGESSLKIEAAKVAAIVVENPADVVDFVLAFF